MTIEAINPEIIAALKMTAPGSSINVITVDPPEPAPAPVTFAGYEVRARMQPGDRIAVILKDHAGQVRGYIVRAELDMLSAGYPPDQIRDYMVLLDRKRAALPEPERLAE